MYSTNDLLEYREEDEATAAVILYVETFGNPEHFGRIARRVARRKPILAIKGRRAQDPHAGAARTPRQLCAGTPWSTRSCVRPA